MAVVILDKSLPAVREAAKEVPPGQDVEEWEASLVQLLFYVLHSSQCGDDRDRRETVEAICFPGVASSISDLLTKYPLWKQRRSHAEMLGELAAADVRLMKDALSTMFEKADTFLNLTTCTKCDKTDLREVFHIPLIWVKC
jgi:hypothetical protein